MRQPHAEITVKTYNRKPYSQYVLESPCEAVAEPGNNFTPQRRVVYYSKCLFVQLLEILPGRMSDLIRRERRLEHGVFRARGPALDNIIRISVDPFMLPVLKVMRRGFRIH